MTGFSGAGKTTAIGILEEIIPGKRLYLGQSVLNEIARRGLERTRPNELFVRFELRRDLGVAALAIHQQDEVSRLVDDGVTVVVDAIFYEDEFQVLRDACRGCPAYLLAIDTPYELRSLRVAERSERPFTPEELRARDDKECDETDIVRVMEAADIVVPNTGSIGDLRDRLTAQF